MTCFKKEKGGVQRDAVDRRKYVQTTWHLAAHSQLTAPVACAQNRGWENPVDRFLVRRSLAACPTSGRHQLVASPSSPGNERMRHDAGN